MGEHLLKWRTKVPKITWIKIIPTVGLVILIVTGLRLFGLLQPLELSALDYYFRLRPPEPLDSRIVIVGITQQDITKLRNYPLTDEVLAQLLEKIRQQNPRAIGLDLYRDLPVPAQKGDGYKKLTSVFQSTPNLVGIEKVMGSGNHPPISPPPALVDSKQGYVAASDIFEDDDGIIRRALLLTPKTARRDRVPTLGFVLADLYLQEEKGIDAQWLENLTLKYNSVELTRFLRNDGGYVSVGDAGYQMLLNYRTPPENFQVVTVTDVLEDRIPVDFMSGRVVLIGNTSPDWKDFFSTPFTTEGKNNPNVDNKFYGVFLQANIISSIVSAVLDDRSLIKTWSEWQEFIWISFWPLIGVVWIWKFGNKKTVEAWNWHKNYFFFIGAFLICTFNGVLVCVITFLAFIREAYWLPVIPPLSGLFASFVLSTRAVYVSKLEQARRNLEAKVIERTEALREATERAKADSRLKELGKSVYGLAHQIQNPLSFVQGFPPASISSIEELEDIFSLHKEKFPPETRENINLIFSELKEDLSNIQIGSERIDKLISMMIAKARSENSTPISTDINKLIDLAVKIVTSSHQRVRNDFSLLVVTEYDPTIAPLQIVADDIHEAVSNLIDNACYTVFEKKAQVGEDFSPTITIKTQKQESYLAITIEDNGEGIAQELIDNKSLFVPFVTKKKSGEGTGLGLTITKELLTKNHGEIFYESQPGKYTKFTIKLPLN